MSLNACENKQTKQRGCNRSHYRRYKTLRRKKGGLEGVDGKGALSQMMPESRHTSSSIWFDFFYVYEIKVFNILCLETVLHHRGDPTIHFYFQWYSGCHSEKEQRILPAPTMPPHLMEDYNQCVTELELRPGELEKLVQGHRRRQKSKRVNKRIWVVT